jgi:hypothetical protein
VRKRRCVLGREKRQAAGIPTSTESREREQRERRIAAAGNLVVRQQTFAECVKKRRVIVETDSDEEDGGNAFLEKQV